MKRRTTNFLSTICLALFVSVLSACSGGGSNPDPSPVKPDETSTGSVSGTVRSAATGAALPGVTVRTGAATVMTAADGSYTLTTAVGERVVLSVETVGFAETFQIARVTAGQPTSLDVQLLPVGVTQSLLAAVGGTVTVPNSSAQVSIPAGGLVPTAGGAAAASVNVAVTPINPALDADTMPGDYTAVLAGDTAPAPIESFGALLIDVRDDSGTRYTLATGQTAAVRIPVGTLSVAPPASIPMLVFNPTTGRWTEEGVATLEGTAPNQVYVGTVARFGFWNADQRMNTVFVSGCVRDTANQPVANAKVKTDGVNYSGTATTFTDTEGNFSVAVRRDALATLSVTFLDRDRKPVTKTENIGPYAADTTLPACIETVPALLQMTARLLPLGVVGTPYSARLTASNGTKPYAWSFSGALPTNLTLDSTTGQISGTPTAAGTFSGTFEVQDSSAPAQTANAPFSITITTPPAFGISTLALPSGVVGTAYSASLSAANGTTPYTWSVLTGNLPTGLMLNEATGQISGTPSVAGSFTFTLQAQDSSAPVKTASAPFTVVIDPVPLPAAPIGVAAVAGNTQATITWSPVSSATSYNLYMASVAGVTKTNYASLTDGMKHTGVTSPYVHTGLTNGTTYYFVVTALNANGESVESVEVSATPTAPPVVPPSAPTGVAAVPGNMLANISWNPVSDATSYNLYMATVAGVTKSNYASLTGGMKHTGVTSPYVHTGLTNDTTYYFVVTAVNANGESVESSEMSATPTAGGGDSRLAAGAFHTCAVMSTGTVRCWGYNSSGQLGNGTTTNSSTPVTVSGITNATAIAAADDHTCALLNNGTVQCWGNNSSGQLGNGTTTSSSTPVSVSGITTATAIAAAGFLSIYGHTCAVLSNGTVQCWGKNSSGQLGNGTTTSSFTPVTVSGITNATAIAAGSYTLVGSSIFDGYACAVLSNGTVQCWGFNGFGQLGNGTTTASLTPVTVSGITTATAVTAGGLHACAVLNNGTAQCWGYNFHGQLGNGTTLNSSTPVAVNGINTATTIAAGSFSVYGDTCAVLSNGTVQCWGFNGVGQLGNGTTTTSLTPVTVIGIDTATAVAAGGSHACAVLSTGTVQCWGSNAYGELGNGTTTRSSIPVTVSGL